MFTSFKGGVHPEDRKISSHSKIKKIRPKRLIIPLQQHIGSPSKPIVKEGDKVKRYQPIAEPSGFVSSAIHAPLSGTVKAIDDRVYAGGICTSIVIDADDTDQEIPLKKEKDIKELIRKAGIVGMGGAAFPTDVKLCTKEGQSIEYYIINACECEPFNTSDHRLMLEHHKEIIKGIRLMLDASAAKKAIIGIEDNKRDAWKLFYKKDKKIEARLLKTKYPQGAEKMLVHVLLNRKVPPKGLPIDVGAVVNNVGTAKAVNDASLGKPLVERVVTVTGDVKNPSNFLAPLGTTYKDLIEAAGGAKKDIKKLLTGGPMMGIAQESLDVPVMKGTNCILVMCDPPKLDDYSHCIRCSRCIDACPMNLMPTLIARYSENGRYALADDYDAMDCIECGCCSYTCPSKIPLLEFIRIAKSEIRNNKKKDQK